MNMPIKVQKFDSVTLEEPTVVSVINEAGEKVFYTLQKEAIRYLYRNLAMSFSESKTLFKADKDSWRRYIEQQSNRDDLEVKFSLKSKYFLFIDSLIIAISDKDITDDINKFFSGITSSRANYSGGFYRVTVDIDYNNIFNKAIIEMDFVNGIYKVEFVVHYNNTYALGTPRVIMRSLEEFINYDINYEYSVLMSVVGTLGLSVGPDILKKIKLSVRELLDISRICKVKFQVDKDGVVSGYQDTQDPIVNKLAGTFRLLGIPFKSIKHMKYLEKSMKITDVSIYDITNLFYENYGKSEYCNADMMHYVFYSVYYCVGDFLTLSNKE